jgi:hypothetical protein
MNALESLKKNVDAVAAKDILSLEEIEKRKTLFLINQFQTFFSKNNFICREVQPDHNDSKKFVAEYKDILIEYSVNDSSCWEVDFILKRYSKYDKNMKNAFFGEFFDNFKDITKNNPDDFLFKLNRNSWNEIAYKKYKNNGFKIEELFIAICEDYPKCK